MRLLDLFCGAGGAAVGYHRAGFDEIVGVDIKPQPHYPFEFIQADAMTFPLDGFDAIHASPPCQAYSMTRTLINARPHPDLLPKIRQRLEESGVAWVIENVVGAPFRHYFTLCGSSFGLNVRRHRRFESTRLILSPGCQHRYQPEPLEVTGTGGPSRRHRKPSSMTEANAAMGIDWMTRQELTQAIPPAYTEYIGRHLIMAVEGA